MTLTTLPMIASVYYQLGPMNRCLLLLAVLLLAGCAMTREELAAETLFIPTPDGFTFRAPAYTNLREDSPEAEVRRLTVLRRFVERNGTCPGGFDIVNREVIWRPATSLGVRTGADIIYSGRCH